MWTLLMPVAAALITTIVVLGLFKAAGLKRVEDLIPPPQEDEWDRLGTTNAKIESGKLASRYCPF